ncbi:MAG: hypothetical protein ABSA70_05425 [Terriglobia bacterium]
MRRTCRLLTLLIVFAVLMAWGAPPTSPQDQSQPDQSQQSQEKSDKDQQKKKKGGGFFGGLKAVTGQSSEQQEATRTAGSKTVGEGEQIGDAQPTAADRQAVKAMENYSIPEKDVKKFQDGGQLKPKQ